MPNIPEELYYTDEHEYVRMEDDNVVVVGITDYAQGELGDVVFVELPEIGAEYQKMDAFGTIEAVKAVSELFCPLGGEIVDVNTDLDDNPGLVNEDPYGAGWMIKIRVENPSEFDQLLTAPHYAEHIGE
jgi:glycine cleavage system H protein